MIELRYHYGADGALVSATLPRFAFKFAAAGDYSISSIRERYLWFSRPAEFNDVFELPVKVRQDLSDSELESYFRVNLSFHLGKFGIGALDPKDLDPAISKLLTDHRDTIAKMFLASQTARRDRVRICCLSLRYDDPLMWAHYAASFAGICLVFDFPALIRDGHWFVLQVHYVDQPSAFDPVSTSLRFHAGAQPYQDVAHNMDYDQEQFGTKLSAWAHEQELRLCTLQPDAKQHYPEEALLGVILGPRVSKQHEQAVLDAASDSRLPFRIERLNVNADDASLTVAGLENTSFEVPVAGVRNLSKELRASRREQLGRSGRDA